LAINIELWEVPPPLLEFGLGGFHTDCRLGLERYGPFSLRFGQSHKIRTGIGLVGPRHMLDAAYRWYERTGQPIAGAHANRAMYPDYPGFERVFRSALVMDALRWEVEIPWRTLLSNLDLAPLERFEAVLAAYAGGIAQLAETDNKPDVVVCCLPPEVIDKCWTVAQPGIGPAARRVLQKRRRQLPQLSLFETWDSEEQPDDLLFRDFRRALKARAMLVHMPIQVGTTSLFQDSTSNQEASVRAWNSSIALFYKAGGIPWRMKADGPETCYLGISFHHYRTRQRHLVFSSLAQAFSSEGDGFALRGESLPWNRDQGREPYLSSDQAATLIHQVLAAYRHRTGRNPMRIVVHKTTRFKRSEAEGLNAALSTVARIELVNLAPGEFRLVQQAAYPPVRGTLCRINDTESFLFTTGYTPEWHTYPGPHVPVPVQLVCGAELDIQQVAADVLALTKMNWNTGLDTTGTPITLRFARRIGGIMTELGPNVQPHPSYRFYM
jgi:hypothetical protein